MKAPCFFQAALLGAALSLSACQKSPVVATIGESEITEQDLALRGQVIRSYFPEYQGDLREAALKQLTSSFTYAEILRNHGHKIDDEVLKKESERIDKSTLLPEKLQQLKAIFAKNPDLYLKDYVLPVYAERVIYFEFFLNDPEIQKASLEMAKAFLESVRTEKGPFKKPEGIAGTGQGKFTVSLSEGIVFDQPSPGPGQDRPTPPPSASPAAVQEKLESRKRAAQSEEGKRWIEEIISQLRPGEVHPQVIDQKESWWVVRYLGPKGKNAPDSYAMELVGFPKADYGKWLEVERARIPSASAHPLPIREAAGSRKK